MWLDVLDMPTINHFQASFASHFDEKMQNVNHENGDSFERYATGVLPDGAPVHLNRSPVINYPYAKMRPILERLKSTGDIDKRHGARVRYANPINGGPVLPTMGANLALLPKGFKGEPYRSTEGTCSVSPRARVRRSSTARSFPGRQRRVRGAAVESATSTTPARRRCCSRSPTARHRKRSESGAKATRRKV
jgi:gentisate 1,2-dioxygenase